MSLAPAQSTPNLASQPAVSLYYNLPPFSTTHEANSILTSAEGKSSTLHVVCRTSPSHQRVLPSSSTLQDVPVNPPHLCLALCRLHSVLRRLEDPDLAVTELSRRIRDDIDLDFTRSLVDCYWSRCATGYDIGGGNVVGGEALADGRGGAQCPQCGGARESQRGAEKRHCA